MEDAIVCGGGPAGLAAALWLGRYRRRTLVLDDGRQRNLHALTSHGYLSRDGASPQELLRSASEDLRSYDTVRVVRARADSVTRRGRDLTVGAGGREYTAHRLL